MGLAVTLGMLALSMLAVFNVWTADEVHPWPGGSADHPAAAGAVAATTPAALVLIGFTVMHIDSDAAVGAGLAVLGMLLAACFFVFLAPAFLIPPVVRGRRSLYRYWNGRQ